MPETSFIFVLVLSVAMDLFVGAIVLLAHAPRLGQGRGTDRRQPTNVGLRRAALAAAAVGALFCVRALALMWAGLANIFGVLHIAYLDIVLAVPALGVLLLVLASGKGRFAARVVLSPVVRIVATYSLHLVAVGVYASGIEPRRLQVESANMQVPAERAGTAPLRIGVIADIQTSHGGRHEQRAVERLMALQPDIVLMPGDLYQGSQAGLAAEMPALQSLLEPLQAPGGVYMVEGNVDRPGSLETAIELTTIRLLTDDIAIASVLDRKLMIGGVGLRRGADWSEVVKQLQTLPGDEDIRILLSHYPDAVLDLTPNSRIDLVVSGHTHGGQVRLPLLGPMITLSSVPRDVAAGGLHSVNGNAIYISRGVGLERGQAPRVRFLCPPDIALIEVRSASASPAEVN